MTPKSALKKRMKKAEQSPLEQLRSVCLSFPEAHEVEAWGEPTLILPKKPRAKTEK